MTDDFVDPETGEYFPDLTADPEARLARLILSRHAAHEQEQAWHRERAKFDAMILGQMETRQIVVEGDVLCKVAQRTTTHTDSEAFAEALRAAELDRTDLYEVVAAAKGFDPAALPVPDDSDSVRRAYAACTTKEPSKPWIETSIVLKRAPEPRAPVAGDMEGELAAAVAKAKGARRGN